MSLKSVYTKKKLYIIAFDLVLTLQTTSSTNVLDICLFILFQKHCKLSVFDIITQ